MSPQRIVLLFSVIIAIIVFTVMAFLHSVSLDTQAIYMYVKREKHITDVTSTSLSAATIPISPSISTLHEQRTSEKMAKLLKVSNDAEERSFTAKYIVTTITPSVLAEISEASVRIVKPSGEKANNDDNTRRTQSLNQYTVHNITLPDAPKFTISNGFNFPHPNVYLPTQTILNSGWVQELKKYLSIIHPARSLTITVATKSFIPNLLNWLIAAHFLVEPPMKHVLVLAFDEAVYNLLAPRKIPCIHIPYSKVVKGNKKGVPTIWMTRFAVIRLLNHWGYNVLQLDSDAVPLKNTDYLFDAYTDYDIVSARGALPFELSRGAWGFTVCMGAALLRGTQGMETLWNVMHSAKMDKTTDDQKRINFALYKSKLKWNSMPKDHQYQHASIGISDNGVRVAALPRKYICRKSCTIQPMSEFFIWHMSGGGHSASWKSKHDAKSQVWFLQQDYNKRTISSSVTGMKWLEQLILPGSIQTIKQKLSPITHTVPET